MSPEFINGLGAGLTVGIFGTAFFVAVFRSETVREMSLRHHRAADADTPCWCGERHHANEVPLPEVYDPSNCWCGESHPGIGHNMVNPDRDPKGEPGEVFIPSSEIKEGLHKKGGLNSAPTTPRPPGPPPAYRQRENK